MHSYILACAEGELTIKKGLFTCSIIGIDLSERLSTTVDLIDGETGEVLCTWSHGILTYDATGR